MCGIVGILGRGAVAGQIVEALKRLEYRGYDSAGIATLENGRLERRRAQGKLRNLEVRLAEAPLTGSDRHRPYPLGDAWRGRPKTMRIPMPPTASPSCITGSSRISANCATICRPAAMTSRPRPTPRWSPISSPKRWGRAWSGRGGGGGAAAAARRLRARLSVRWRRGSSDRRPPRRALGGRLRRRGNVSRLRCLGAGPVH